jgi:uncharacterized protein YlxW (UPF0749 family)
MNKQEEVKALASEIRRLKNHIKELKKAGDEMAKDLSNPIDPDILKYYSVEKWDEIVMKKPLD